MQCCGLQDIHSSKWSWHCPSCKKTLSSLPPTVRNVFVPVQLGAHPPQQQALGSKKSKNKKSSANQDDLADFLQSQTFKIGAGGSLLSTSINGSELSIQLKHSTSYDVQQQQQQQQMDDVTGSPVECMEVKKSLFSEDLLQALGGSTAAMAAAGEDENTDLSDVEDNVSVSSSSSPVKKGYEKLKAAKLIRFKKRKMSKIDLKQSSILQFLSPGAAVASSPSAAAAAGRSPSVSPQKPLLS